MKPFVADVHTHSLMSGHAFGTIREMAAAASEQGLELLGVTEHGPGIPGTVNPIYFRNFGDAPRNLFGVEMLYGSEVNVPENWISIAAIWICWTTRLWESTDCAMKMPELRPTQIT